MTAWMTVDVMGDYLADVKELKLAELTAEMMAAH